MSDDRKEELKRNVLSPSQWIRILYMAFYAVACWVLTIILTVIIVAQILISLITGRDNENLRTVGKRVSDYFHEMLDYLVYASNEKPWPFDGSDEDDKEDEEDEEDDSAAATEADTVTDSAEAASSGDGQPGEDEFADISYTDNADTVKTDESENFDSEADDKDKS